MKNRLFLCAVISGLLVQTYGEVIFHDSFQAGDDTAPNTNEAFRQTAGLVTSGYNLTTYGDRSADNYHRIMDPESTGETALELGVHKPLVGVGAVSWTASRVATDLSSYLATGGMYEITWDTQLRSGGATPQLFNSDIAFGILGSTGSTVTPMTAESIFGIRLDADGGGFDVYSNGTNLYSSSTGSTLDWNERFELTFVVNELRSTVQVFLQGAGDSEANDLGTYDVDFGSGGRIIQMYSSQTDNGSGEGGKLEAEVFELDISLIPDAVGGAVVFNDTFQSDDELINHYEPRQSNGLTLSSYKFSAAGNVANQVRVLDTSYIGTETAAVLKMFNPAYNSHSTSAIQLGSDFAPYVEGGKYDITLSFRIISGGGNPAVETTWFGIGIIRSSDTAYVPESVNTDFGIRLAATGGGFQVYMDGTLLYSDTISPVTYGKRFNLMMKVDETGAVPSARVLVQKVGGPTIDLGTYDFDVDPADTELFLQLRGYTKDDELTSGGLMTIEIYELEIHTEP